MKRASGILLHISSLPGSYGIGTLGKEARTFIDFLDKAGQEYWQILPIGPTGYGNSPYQSYSTYAGNPYFIDLDELVALGLLQMDEVKATSLGHDPQKVDFEILQKNKKALLRKAYERGFSSYKTGIKQFYREEKNWLDDYSLFMALKSHFKGGAWQDWPIGIKHRKTMALMKAKRMLKKEIQYYIFEQFMFYKQWHAIKTYANQRGIKIIGDIPIYVATDSADTWANPKLFKLDEKLMPIVVAGCPPDSFSETGQLWGNPIYDWRQHRASGYKWWIQRFKKHADLFDTIRIDHFRGFASFWEISADDLTAKDGKWVTGPGIELFKAVEKKLGSMSIIAEDLGFLTEEVFELRDACGFPGMKVLEFAFDTREESDYLPHNYEKNTVVYTGTHDNDTVMGWMVNAHEKDVQHAIQYLNLSKEEGYHFGFIRGAFASVSDLAITQMQDVLGESTSKRMNTPSTVNEDNWSYRLSSQDLTEELALKLYHVTKLYGRLKSHAKS